MQLDLRVASEERDPNDHRLDRALDRLVQELDIVRPHEELAERLGVTDERHHELARRLVVELARATDLLELPVVDDRDLIRDLHRLALVVRDEDGRDVDDVVQLPKPLAKLRANARVESSERLVEEQNLRLGRERTREPHPLPLPSRQLGRVAMAEVLELDEVQKLVDALCDLGFRPLAHLQSERDVVAHRHVLERSVVLEDEADVPLLRSERGGVLSAEEDLSRVRGLEPGDDAEQRRLARAARAEESRQRSALDVERDVVEGDEVAETFRDVANEDGHVRRLSSFGRMTVMATSTRIAIIASTIEMA